MNSIMNCAILARGLMTLVPRFDPAVVLQVIQRDRANVFGGVPTMYSALLNHPDRAEFDTSSLTLCISGKSALPVEVLRGFDEAFGAKVLEGYGMSETTGMATARDQPVPDGVLHLRRVPGGLLRDCLRLLRGKANSLANWYWIAAAIAIAVVGFASDRVLVRKPFMIAGALISLVGLGLFATAATNPSTGYYRLAFYFVLIAVGVGMAYVAWMAGFTETVEAHNPAATATGLAIYGWTVRTVVFLALILLPVVVPATTTLADKGARVSSIVATYPKQVKVLNTVDPATLGALTANASNTAAQAKAVSELSGLPVTDVAKVVILGGRYIKELATAGAVDPATLTALSTNPTNQAAG